VRCGPVRDKRKMASATAARRLLRGLLDFALPPRCPGCGTIVDHVHSFCVPCWTAIEFLGSGGCETCGIPLEATDAGICAVCLAVPPRISRTRAAVAYGDIARTVALKLKYGRKVALAKTMANYMAPLLEPLSPTDILAPVPLHRRRLWQRGFNQAAIVMTALSQRTGIPGDARLIERVKRTPPLKGMSALQRRRTVAGAFKVRDGADLRGRTVVLIDDVLTTGATANACARALKRAGAERVELVSWARVIRPSQLA
jgi:ComF family protein